MARLDLSQDLRKRAFVTSTRNEPKRKNIGEIFPNATSTRNEPKKKNIGEIFHENSRRNNQVDISLVSLLKVSAKKKDLRAGIILHDEILGKGLLEKDPYVASTLISMYAKCGAMEKAQRVLDDLPVQDVVSWNALISGYVEQGQSHEALNCIEIMKSEGIHPNAVTFICFLKAFASTQDIKKGEQIHKEIVNRCLLENDIVLGTALVDMYAKCGALDKAQQVLKELPARNVFSWSALIAGYAQQGQCHNALHCLQQMQSEGISPNAVTFICILKACGSIGAIEEGKLIHDEIVARGIMHTDIVLGNALVDMYAKCGMLAKARKVLEELPVRDVVTWNALIAGCVQHEQYYEALNCLECMEAEGLCPDVITSISILKACGHVRALDKGKQIHGKLVNRGMLQKDTALHNALVDMFAKCGALAEARQVLKELHVRDTVSWNVLIANYVQQDQGHKAFDCFEQMQREGVSPDVVTFLCILKACASAGALEKGQTIHDEIMNRGLLKKDLMLGNALVDMYVKCGLLMKAEKILMGLPRRNAVSWNALISGYVLCNKDNKALTCFQRMRSEGISPDVVTYITVIKACSHTGAIGIGHHIQDEIVSKGLLEKDMGLGNALVDMYVKCGVIAKAQQVLDMLPIRDVISWNALIAGFAEEEQCDEALNCYEWMRIEGLSPDEVTFICILKACARTGAVDKGKQIHEDIRHRGLLGKDIMLDTALIDMYAKCGMLSTARQVLEELPIRDVVSWNALIAGYAQQGQGHEALSCYNRMQGEGMSPDEVTFVCCLNACSHSGLSDESEMLFGNMTRKYGITPSLEHHTCMVVVFGCAGHFEKAMSVIKVMPSSDHLAVWLALLGGCRKWTNVKLGRLAFDQAVQLDNSCAEAYLLMATIFASAGIHEDAMKIEAMMLKYAGYKKKGNSVWVDAWGNAHSFSAEEANHIHNKNINSKLKAIEEEMSREGCCWVSPRENLNDRMQCGHCDLQAVACALINTCHGETIYISNDMYICDKCHFYISYVSRIEKRKIMVKDLSKHHVFERGRCACGRA